MNLPNFPSRPLLPHCWMTDIPVIEALTFAELSLPGAHNAGVDNKAYYSVPAVKHWAACQSDSFYHQLNAGARALDLRLEYESAREGLGYFWFQHNGFRSSRTLEELIMKVIRFLQENPDEFILLDFHQLNAAHEPFPYEEFNRMLKTHLGSRIIPRANAALTLGQLKKLSRTQRVLVAAERNDGLDSTYFCRQIKHKWSGIGTTSVNQLHAHITQVMEHPPRTSEPWSLSATSYSAVGGPVDIGQTLDAWFDPVASDWVLKSNIINMDFVERSRLVDHCRHANITKANAIRR